MDVLSLAARYLPTLALVWLAVFFGRTLRAGETPLIERVARIGKPALSPALRRYTRRLTALWCAWFVLAAATTLAVDVGFRLAGGTIAACAVVFFVGEHVVRRRLFPHEWFPDLAQQIRDTAQVWRPRREP